MSRVSSAATTLMSGSIDNFRWRHDLSDGTQQSSRCQFAIILFRLGNSLVKCGVVNHPRQSLPLGRLVAGDTEFRKCRWRRHFCRASSFLCLPLAAGLHIDQQFPRPALGANSDLRCLILEFEVARLLRVNTNGFRLVTDRFHLIDPVGGGERPCGRRRIGSARSYRSECGTEGAHPQVVLEEPVHLR